MAFKVAKICLKNFLVKSIYLFNAKNLKLLNGFVYDEFYSSCINHLIFLYYQCPSMIKLWLYILTINLITNANCTLLIPDPLSQTIS